MAMHIPAFLKRKRTYVIAALVVLAAGWLVNSRVKSNKVTYETVAATTRDLMQTVEVTGVMKPASRIDLSFKNSGAIDRINVKVGDVVKKGDILASLKADDVTFAVRNAAAQLAAAQASLNARLAGSTDQAIRVAEAQVEQAQAAYDKAVSDLASTKKTTQDAVQASAIALQTAQNNLNNQGAIIAQNVQNAVDGARVSLLTALGPLNTGLTDGDQITGVDNTAANSTYLNVLGFLDAGALERAKNSYTTAKNAKNDAERAVKALTNQSSETDIEAAAASLQNAITLVQSYLGDVQKVLAASLTNASLTDAVLSAKKSMIDGDRTAVSAQNSAVLAALQSIKNAKLSKTTTASQLQDAFAAAQTNNETAKTNAEVQVRTAETNVAIQQASLDSAKASWDLQRSPPRGVDVAPLRASVDQAKVVYDKAVNDLQNVEIIAPVDGTISEILPSVGEQIAMNTAAIRMVGVSTYDIEAKVPEADIAKVAVGQTATSTLDAYGDDVKFAGSVIDKDPAETLVQDAVYYKIHVQVEPAGHEIKPGMTANVTVNAAARQGVIVIPLRAVRTDVATQQKSVRVLVNGQPVVKKVTIGLKGDEGMVEIAQGVTEGDQVIVSEKNPAGTTAATP